jgi:hypothetical protein
MKKIGFLTVVALALLVLATGAWIADGIRAVRHAGRTRRVADAVEGRGPYEERRARSARRPEGANLVAVA